ncbi:uncharacterized protein LOC132298678 [Cornus florida]|uniref:uncharacterized protein LOC132298678 n=1 Tax=Cornus florida TaxID=4283 RepID=UPI00289F885F|nr:uncharacterized protein LOC132298678 [Cornus florida]
MMSFCKKSVHSLLYFTNFMANGAVLESPTNLQNIPSPAGGLSFITLFDDLRQPIESAGLKSPPSSPTTTAPAATKRNSVKVGFLDDVSGIDGGSCTERLGFESSDESFVDDEIENVFKEELGSKPSFPRKSRLGRTEKVCKSFPPPLPSLEYCNGRPTFVLRPTRKDGRLELNVVKIERPEIFRASRQDGRLRLSVVVDEDSDAEENEAEYETKEDKEEVVEERGGGSRWPFSRTNGGGDGFSRCHVAVSHHHNHPHSLQVW